MSARPPQDGPPPSTPSTPAIPPPRDWRAESLEHKVYAATLTRRIIEQGEVLSRQTEALGDLERRLIQMAARHAVWRGMR